jgi:hypothetical protein
MRDAYRFKLQVNAQAESKSLQDWLNSQGSKGTHADVTSVDIPVDADEDEFKDIMDPKTLTSQID